MNSLNLEEIGLDKEVSLSALSSIQIDSLPVYRQFDQSIKTKKGVRAKLEIEKMVNHGSYGNLYLAKRSSGTILPVIIKQPRLEEMNLLQEAILQHLAHKTLVSNSIPWAIPKVYDVFQSEKKVWFSMEKIQGKGIASFLEESKNPDLDFFLFLAQISVILLVLEENMSLDHRDLKLDNLLVKKESCCIRFSLGGTTWRLQCPFQIILLDFGFACIGSASKVAIINLGDGVLPPMDPCPKEGRDLFHLLISLLSFKPFCDSISSFTKELIDSWLSVGDKSYGPMAKKWGSASWVYLVTSQRNFSASKCTPYHILNDLRKRIPTFLSS